MKKLKLNIGESGEKAGKLLLHCLKQKCQQNTIFEIVTEDDQRIMVSESIRKQDYFILFFKNVSCKLEDKTDQQDINKY